MLNTSISLTGTEDTDRQILFHLHDKELFNACYISNYYNGLCNNKFWFQKFCQVFEANLNEYQNIDYRKLYKQLRSMTDVDILYFATNKEYLPLLNTMIKRLVRKGEGEGEEKGEEDFYVIMDEIFLLSVKNDQLNVIKYLFGVPEIEKSKIRYANLLHYAICCGWLDIVKFLIDNNPIRDNKTKYDEELLLAAEKGHLHIVKFLVDIGTDVHETDEYVFKIAAGYGHLHILKYLVEKGCNINVNHDDSLMFAQRRGHAHIVEYLLDSSNGRPPNVHAANDHVLRFAAQDGQFDIVKILIKYGANIHAQNDDALIWAATHGHFDIVKYLIELPGDHADIHAQNDKIVECAAAAGHLNILRYLIDNNEINRLNINAYNCRAIGRAAQCGRLDVVTYLIDYATKYEGSPLIGYMQTHADEDGPLANIASMCGTALKSAAKGGHLPILKFLMENNSVDEYLDDAFLCAALCNRPDVLRYLIENGANCQMISRAPDNIKQIIEEYKNLKSVK